MNKLENFTLLFYRVKFISFFLSNIDHKSSMPKRFSPIPDSHFVKDPLRNEKKPPTQESYENREFIQKYMHINDARLSHDVNEKNAASLNERLNPIYPHGSRNASKSKKSKTSRIVNSDQEPIIHMNNKPLHTMSIGKYFELHPEASHRIGQVSKIGEGSERNSSLGKINQRICLTRASYPNRDVSHTYENTDAQEEAIYQNLIFANGKSFPESRKSKENLLLLSDVRKKSQVFGRFTTKSKGFPKTHKDATKNKLGKGNSTITNCTDDKVYTKG